LLVIFFSESCNTFLQIVSSDKDGRDVGLLLGCDDGELKVGMGVRFSCLEVGVRVGIFGFEDGCDVG